MLSATAVGVITLAHAGLAIAASCPTIPEIQWVDCKTAVPSTLVQANVTLPDTLPTTLKCGQLVVPLDYGHKVSPENNITVGFAMYRPQNPKGLINFNPGGPGVEVPSYAWALALEDPKSSLLGLKDFDILAMDTRGTHSSTPINCTFGDYVIPSLIPSTQEEFDTYHDEVTRFVQGCIDKSQPRLLEYLSSIETVQDWNSIRKALGYKKMSLLGESYGTFSSPLYASKFPKNVDKMVLDATFPHKLPLPELMTFQSRTLNNLLARSDAACMNDTTCPLHDQGKGAIQQAFQAAITLAEESNADGNSPADIRATVYNIGLTGHPKFADLNGALALAVGQSNWTALTYNTIVPQITEALFPSMPTLCLDLEIGNAKTFEGYQTLLDAHRSVDVNNMGYGHDLLIAAVCGAWPIPARADREIHTKAPTMFIATDFDLNTPIESTFFQRHQQMPNTPLIVRHGDGHISFDVPGPFREIGTAFLVNGSVPDATENEFFTVVPAGTSFTAVKDPYEVPIGEPVVEKK